MNMITTGIPASYTRTLRIARTSKTPSGAFELYNAFDGQMGVDTASGAVKPLYMYENYEDDSFSVVGQKVYNIKNYIRSKICDNIIEATKIKFSIINDIHLLEKIQSYERLCSKKEVLMPEILPGCFFRKSVIDNLYIIYINKEGTIIKGIVDPTELNNIKIKLYNLDGTLAFFRDSEDIESPFKNEVYEKLTFLEGIKTNGDAFYENFDIADTLFDSIRSKINEWEQRVLYSEYKMGSNSIGPIVFECHCPMCGAVLKEARPGELLQMEGPLIKKCQVCYNPVHLEVGDSPTEVKVTLVKEHSRRENDSWTIESEWEKPFQNIKSLLKYIENNDLEQVGDTFYNAV